MQIESGQIVKNLIPSEPVIINKIQKLGLMYSINYTGINSKQANTKVIDEQIYIHLDVLAKEGTFTFNGDPIKFSLYAEAERISSAYQFDPLFAVNCSIVDPLPHQVEAVYKFLLPLPKIRFLLADDTGAGKTIMTGLLIKELMMRGLLERILIITPGGLTKQWQEDELGLKFNIPFKLVNRASFISEPTIFSNSDRLITSIDFLRNEDVLNVVKESSWDMIIVDEAHKLTAFDYGQKRYLSKRYQALEILANQCEHLLLLTATPHRGRKDTFKNLLQLIDKDIFASDSLVTSRVQEIGEKGINKFFIRRLKEEMKDWQGNPLFKARHTKTVLYKLTPEEKKLYDRVTDYLLSKRQEATAEANIHVSLALMVMQRRLTSSIYAIMRTLNNRYKALKGLLDQLAQNPNLWQQKQKLDLDMQSLEDFDEFNDEERESLENIISDPRKFKLFTTAKNPGEIREEAEHVKSLLDLAKSLYEGNQEEQKYKKLRELLETQGVLKERKEKLVIFTEHKDTLDYLEQRLKNTGYEVVTIHGSKSVDERRSAQIEFARNTQILIATDAAGEGINLQFCRLLINWDIPWNPNRLEQRMGRIHRYGQKQDVLVFNMVAQNTREGNVLERILTKLDLIREQMGDDRVFDVISDVFESVSLDDIINSTLNGLKTTYDTAIESELTAANVEKKIKEQKEKLGYSLVDYKDARELKDHSDEKRLQPIYVRMFFEKALSSLGGQFREIRKSIFKIEKLPQIIIQRLKLEYKIQADISQILFCFDKQVFLEYQSTADLGTVHFINPGNPLFDALVKTTLEIYKEEMLKGTILISPVDTEAHLAFLVKSQITDNRPHKERENIADEKLILVCGNAAANFTTTSPAKLIDLHAPALFAKNVDPPEIVDNEEVTAWAFENLTIPQFDETQLKVKEDAEKRKDYLEEAFTNIIVDLTTEINELQAKILLGDPKVQERITKKQQRITELNQKKRDRLQKLELMQQVNMKPPEVLGCAYIVPLNKIEYQNHYGMSRDDEVERIAMETAIEYELRQGWMPEDVSKENAGYDIRSSNPDFLKRYIEVKGRSADGGVMLSENEMNRLAQLGDAAWLYVVIQCKIKPLLFRVQNPAKNLSFEMKSKGVQYFVKQDEWKDKAENA
jgi:superfamily II DNA or RNA helicase